MTIAVTVTMRDSKSTIFTPDRAVADAAWNAAKCNPDVVCVSGGIVCCTVPLGANKYTYFCDKLYKHGTKVVVPTPWGNKVVPVIESKIITKQALERIAAQNRFSFNDYKSIVGLAK